MNLNPVCVNNLGGTADVVHIKAGSQVFAVSALIVTSGSVPEQIVNHLSPSPAL